MNQILYKINVQKFTLKKNLFDQFISIAEREIDTLC